jgi:hypothetical protein
VALVCAVCSTVGSSFKGSMLAMSVLHLVSPPDNPAPVLAEARMRGLEKRAVKVACRCRGD